MPQRVHEPYCRVAHAASARGRDERLVEHLLELVAGDLAEDPASGIASVRTGRTVPQAVVPPMTGKILISTANTTRRTAPTQYVGKLAVRASHVEPKAPVRPAPPGGQQGYREGEYPGRPRALTVSTRLGSSSSPMTCVTGWYCV